MISLTVEGMTCQGCVRSVSAALARLDPAADIKVTLENGLVEVQSSKSRDDIAAAIEAAGFDVRA